MAIRCEFDVGADASEFHTRTNGDKIYIGRVASLHIDATNAANLANLINNGEELHVIIKKKVE